MLSPAEVLNRFRGDARSASESAPEPASNKDNEWLELVLENSSDAIIIVDRRRSIRYANKAAAALAERPSAQELFGVSYDGILAHYAVYDESGAPLEPEYFPSNSALYRGVATRSKVVRQMHTGNGKQRWLSISSIPLFVDEETEQARFAIIFFTDISERKLREDRVQLLIESSKILSVTSDLRGQLLEKAKLIVPLMADWCTINLLEEGGGLERVAVVHRDLKKRPLVIKMAEIAGQGNGMFTAIKTGVPVFMPILSRESLAATFPTEEGQKLVEALKPESSMMIPIISGERVLGALSLAYAGSGRIYTPEDLEFMREFCYLLGVLVDNARLYQEIEKRDKAKDAFIAALSHELRNPLAPIKSSLEHLKLQTTEPLVKEALGVIEYQFKHINEILRDLLDVNRFSRGTLTIEKRLLDLRALLEQAAAINKPLLSHKNIALQLTLPSQALFVDGDETRLQQALMNILQNAERFTRSGGKVSISVRRHKKSLVISIQDDGIGIEPQDLPILFDPYARRKQRGKKTSGLGLGLALVRDIARLHGGDVRAKSKGLGHGSTFELVLPLSRRQADAASQKAAPEIPASSFTRKVFIVDDNDAAAKGLSLLLRHHGHQTALAYTGRDALRIMKEREFEPTAVLLDIGLPDLTGYQVARKLREEFGSDLLLIALTGYGQQEDIDQAKAAGFDHHLTKPVSIVDVQALLLPHDAEGSHLV